MPYNATGIAAICSQAAHAAGLEMDPAFSTSSERRSAARAILRHKLHAKNDAVKNGASGGLDLWFKDLHGRGNTQETMLLLKDSFNDLLDAVRTYSLYLYSISDLS